MKKRNVAILILFLTLYCKTNVFAGGGVIAGDGYPGPGHRVGQQTKIPFPLPQEVIVSKLQKLVHYFPSLSIKMKMLLDQFLNGPLLVYSIPESSDHMAGFEVIYTPGGDIQWAVLYFWGDFKNLPLESTTKNPSEDSQVKVIIHEFLHLLNTFNHELTTQRLDTLLMTLLYADDPSPGLIEEIRGNLLIQDNVMPSVNSSEAAMDTYAALLNLGARCQDFIPKKITPLEISVLQTPDYLTQKLYDEDPFIQYYWHKCSRKFSWEFNTNAIEIPRNPDLLDALRRKPDLFMQMYHEILDYIAAHHEVTIEIDAGPWSYSGYGVDIDRKWPAIRNCLFVKRVVSTPTNAYEDTGIRFFKDIAKEKKTVALLSELNQFASKSNRGLYTRQRANKDFGGISVRENLTELFEYFLFNQEGATLSLLPTLRFKDNIHVKLSQNLENKFDTLVCHYYTLGEFRCDGQTKEGKLMSLPLYSRVTAPYFFDSLGQHYLPVIGHRYYRASYPTDIISLNQDTQSLYFTNRNLKKPRLYDFIVGLIGSEEPVATFWAQYPSRPSVAFVRPETWYMLIDWSHILMNDGHDDGPTLFQYVLTGDE